MTEAQVSAGLAVMDSEFTHADFQLALREAGVASYGDAADALLGRELGRGRTLKMSGPGGPQVNTRTEVIEAIGIDSGERLWVKPETATFPAIFRAGMEVHWDHERRCVYSPKPRNWSYVDWFRQIRTAVLAEYGVELTLKPTTSWWNVDADLQRAIREAATNWMGKV